MWPNIGKPFRGTLTDLQPVEVLYELDCPRIFTCLDENGELLLSYLCEETNDTFRFLIVPFSELLSSRLKNGEITVLEALTQPRIWLITADNDWSVSNVALVRQNEVPITCLPRPNIMLWPELQPIISVKAVGNELDSHTVRGSAIIETIQKAGSAFEILLRRSAQKIGVPLMGGLKSLVDLPTQKLAYGSFEVAFRAPRLAELSCNSIDNIQLQRILAETRNLLLDGVKMTTANFQAEAVKDQDASDTLAVLEAARALSPTARSRISEIQVSGYLLDSSSRIAMRLNRHSYKNAGDRIKAITGTDSVSQAPVQIVGVIKLLGDNSPYQMTLEPTDGGKVVNFEILSERKDIWNEAVESLRIHREVCVSGVKQAKSNKYTVIQLHACTKNPVS